MTDGQEKLARKLTTFDATLIVMGGMVGSGIFLTPPLVAQLARTAPLIVATWILGGVVALAGAFIFAELAARRPGVSGVYGYLRDGLHPAIAFTAGWTALLVSYTGAMAASAIAFAAYLEPMTGWHIPLWITAAALILALTFVNCLGVRSGSTTQNVFMVLKIAAIAAIILTGFFGASHPAAALPGPIAPGSWIVLVGFALVPVLFAYDGWQTAPFIDAELKDARRSMPRALLWGVIGVIALYLAITLAALRMLGPDGLAHSHAPAADMVRNVFGAPGQRAVAAAVAISTLGYLSNAMLVSPRLYYAMAADGLFFKQLAWIHPRTQVPVIAIAVQGIIAAIITAFNGFQQIVTYVTSIDFIYFALIAYTLFVFRRRDPEAHAGFAVPGHPWTTLFFIAASVYVVVNALITVPRETLIGIGILLTGIPVYFYWRSLADKATAASRVSPIKRA
ncbi:MAG TPA: amino acid permease [Candidatus Rubrimentiphilum sp.]|nr:amino acid permease [Candidatus Rubrimentiphilum sp.]